MKTLTLKRLFTATAIIVLSFVLGWLVDTNRIINKGMQRRANQGDAYSTVSSIRTAEERLISGTGRSGTFDELKSAGVIDPASARGASEGYHYELKLNGKGYILIAIPNEYGESGTISYYLNETGVIHYSYSKEIANANDEALVEKPSNQ